MQIAICDDDPVFVEQLTSLTEDYFKRSHLKCPQISTFDSGEDLLIGARDLDLVFLDIEMPGLSGITAGNELKKANKNILVVIVTAYSEYLDEAMRFHVFRYLSKPLEKQRFFRCLKDALQAYSMANFKVAVETRQGVRTVPASDIIMVEALGKKVTVHTLSSDIESTRTIQEWQKLLPENCFFPTHRSFIINMAHVSEFDHSLVHLNGDQFTAYLTKRKYTAFNTAYLLYLESTR